MGRETQIKVCGITCVEDANACAWAGVQAMGFNFSPHSKRQVTPEQARSILQSMPEEARLLIQPWGVFVDADPKTIREVTRHVPLQAIQLHGDEPPAVAAALSNLAIMKAFAWRGPETAAAIERYLADTQALGGNIAAVLIDSRHDTQFGGTGQYWDWEQLRQIPNLSFRRQLVIAGGLNPHNVGQAIEILKPAAVDVASGVESSTGVKDHAKIAAFVHAVRVADRRLQTAPDEPFHEPVPE